LIIYFVYFDLFFDSEDRILLMKINGENPRVAYNYGGPLITSKEITVHKNTEI